MDGADPISFFDPHCARSAVVRGLILQPHDAIDYNEADWIDTLVIVERGELEVECPTGRRALFGEGAVLAFVGLTVQRLHNAGDRPLVLSAVSRRR